MLVFRNRLRLNDPDLLADISGIALIVRLELLSLLDEFAVFRVLFVSLHRDNDRIFHLVGDYST